LYYVGSCCDEYTHIHSCLVELQRYHHAALAAAAELVVEQAPVAERYLGLNSLSCVFYGNVRRLLLNKLLANKEYEAGGPKYVF
jgi:hypothetical protein